MDIEQQRAEARTLARQRADATAWIDTASHEELAEYLATTGEGLFGTITATPQEDKTTTTDTTKRGPGRPRKNPQQATAQATGDDKTRAIAELLATLGGGVTEEKAREIAHDIAEDMIASAIEPRERIITITQDGQRHEIGEHVHPCVEEALPWVTMGQPVVLYGDAGSGKTTAAQHIAKALGLEFFFDSGKPDMSTTDFYGYTGINGEYVEKNFIRSFTREALYLIDEADNINPSTLTGLNAPTGNRMLTTPDARQLTANDKWRMIAAINTIGHGADDVYLGRFPWDGATRDRYVFIRCDYDRKLEKHLAGDLTDWLDRVTAYRKANSKLKMRHIFGTRAVETGARGLRSGIPEANVIAQVLRKGIAESDWTRLSSEAGYPA